MSTSRRRDEDEMPLSFLLKKIYFCVVVVSSNTKKRSWSNDAEGSIWGGSVNPSGGGVLTPQMCHIYLFLFFHDEHNPIFPQTVCVFTKEQQTQKWGTVFV